MLRPDKVETRRGTSMPGGCIDRFSGAPLLLLVAACVRPPLADGCPDLAEGDLVISEMRGPQSGSYRQWIEVYNPTDAPIPANGLRFEFTRLDGSNFFTFFVRDEALSIAPGGSIVIGGGAPEEHPYIDYDYTGDHHSTTPGKENDPSDLYGAGTLDLSVCGLPLDHIFYTLPSEGTLSLDGSAPPDAATNDTANADKDDGWCANLSPGEGPQTGIGLNGSPGEANPPCP